MVAPAPPAPPPMTAEAALRQAEAEGLTLVRSESRTGRTGYKGVTFKRSSTSSPYQAKLWRGGKTVHLGIFATVEEAALCYARTPETQAAAAAPPAPPPLSAEESLRQAELEGLTLLRSASFITGYKGVRFKGIRYRAKPYQATVRRGGKQVHLGYSTTAEEAALVVARASAAQAAAPQPPSASSRKRKAKPEEQPRDVPADVVVIIDGHFVDGGALFS